MVPFLVSYCCFFFFVLLMVQQFACCVVACCVAKCYFCPSFLKPFNIRLEHGAENGGVLVVAAAEV